MKAARFKLGLIAEGNTAFSTTLALLKLTEELGPIKSLNLSAARRLSNTLRAGYPTPEYAGLGTAGMLLIRAPEQAVPRIVKELDASGLDLHDLPVVLCESWLGVGALSALTGSGALVATTVNVPVDQKDWFAVDGHARAVRRMRRLIEGSGGRCTEMDSNGKHMLYAADLLLSVLPVPLFTAAQQSLRASGLSGNLLATVTEQMLARTVRNFLRQSGTKSRKGGPMLDCLPTTSETHLAKLADIDKQVAACVAQQLALARGVGAAAK